MAHSKKTIKITIILIISLLPLTSTPAANLSWTEQIEVDTFGSLRQVERYQLKTAEKFYTKGEFAAAAAEYEKYITLYETSNGAAYAQLMWSHCLINQRKVYTGIRDGFQSVIDYWPNSIEAKTASYLIGKSYKDIGELKKAESAYSNAIINYPNHHIALLSKWGLSEIATIKKDEKRLIQIWKDIVLKTANNKRSLPYITKSTQNLARHYFSQPDYNKAIDLLASLYEEDELNNAIYQNSKDAVSNLCRNKATKINGEKLADQIISIIMKSIDNADNESQPELFRRVARTHERAQRDLEVINTYELMAKKLGMNDSILGKIASWHSTKKRFSKSREFYAKFENKVEGLKNIAQIWIIQKQTEQAIQVYNRLIKSAPDEISTWKHAIAKIYSSEKKYEKAIEAYRELTTLDPSNAGNWHWSTGEIHEITNQLKLAIKSYRQTDRYPQSYFKMAKCHRKLKEHTEALTLYHQILANEKSASDATIEIGYTYEEQLDKKNAIKWFQRTCKLFPSSRNASKAHSHLQKKYGISVTLGGSKEK